MTRISTTLEQILKVLHDRGMDDVLLQEGEPVVLRKGDKSVQVSRDALQREQILRMLDQRGDADVNTLEWPPEYATADGRRVSVQVGARSEAAQALQVVLARRDSDAVPTPATLNRRRADDADADNTATAGSDAGSDAGLERAAGSERADRAERAEALGTDGSDGYSATRHPGRRASDRKWGSFPNRQAALERLEGLLRKQVAGDAADLHLRVGEPPVLRSRGDLVRLTDEEPLTDHELTAMVTSAMPKRNEVEFAEVSDTDFAYEIAGLSRFRANVLKDRNGTAAVFRTIAAGTVTVDEMGISPEVRQLCYLSKGLVLVTGPTGSGKSTTMCALIDLINRTRNDHIITIEDPIEFVHQNKKCLITQRQVGVHTQSFKSALRAALREDPDVVLVGELRDLETVAIAIETAETGHLVFGTLHTATAAGTIDRIIDQFPADRQEQIRVMLAESLKGVVSQTLLKRNGGGRIAAREVMIVNSAVSNLIREGKTVQIPSIIQTNKRLGMVLLNDALMELVNAGEVDALEAYSKAVDKANLADRLKARGFDVVDLQRQRDARPE